MKRVAAFVLAAAVLTAAASGAETYRFTLEQAIAYGLQNSASIKCARHGVLADLLVYVHRK